jgi:Domain of unknown function (DUF4386)
MTDQGLTRFTALIGIATAALALVAIAIFASLSAPTQSDSGEQVAQFFSDHRTVVSVLIYLVALSFGFNLVFFIALRDLLKRRAPDLETLSTIGAIGGIVFLAVAFVGFGVLLQLAYREGAGDPATQRTLFDIYSLNITMTGVPTAVCLVAFSLVILRSRALPNWLAWYGFAVAAAHLLSMGSLARGGFFSPDIVAGFIAPLMFYVWMLALSALLLVKPGGFEVAR